MPSLIGLKSRHSTCKICSSFSDEDLNLITLDLLTSQRTWQQIMEYYNPKIKPGTKPLNVINLNSHKKHCDIARITQDDLRSRGFLATTSAEALFKLYQQKKEETISYSTILQETTRQRIGNLEHLQAMFETAVREWQQAVMVRSPADIKRTQASVISLQKEIDETLADMSRTVASHIRTEKGLADTQVVINMVNVFTNSVRTAMAELMSVLVLQEFAREPEIAKRVHKRVAEVLDRHVSPVLTGMTTQKQLTGRIAE